MICGGIYEYTDYRGIKLQGTLVSVEAGEPRKGTLLVHGYAAEVIVEGSERYGHLTLIATPTLIAKARRRLASK
tara:strand:- start:2545 stop:2766 length:222 start_codon:yes stop_codon:yes gene_type:complete